MHETCSVCGLRYLRNPGDTWLSWIVMDRIPLAIGLILVVFFGVRPLTSPSGLLFFGSLAIPLVATMPQRQGLAIAMNYLSRVCFPDPSDKFPPPWEGGVSCFPTRRPSGGVASSVTAHLAAPSSRLARRTPRQKTPGAWRGREASALGVAFSSGREGPARWAVTPVGQCRDVRPLRPRPLQPGDPLAIYVANFF